MQLLLHIMLIFFFLDDENLYVGIGNIILTDNQSFFFKLIFYSFTRVFYLKNVIESIIYSVFFSLCQVKVKK